MKQPLESISHAPAGVDAVITNGPETEGARVGCADGGAEGANVGCRVGDADGGMVEGGHPAPVAESVRSIVYL